MNMRNSLRKNRMNHELSHVRFRICVHRNWEKLSFWFVECTIWLKSNSRETLMWLSNVLDMKHFESGVWLAMQQSYQHQDDIFTPPKHNVVHLRRCEKNVDMSTDGMRIVLHCFSMSKSVQHCAYLDGIPVLSKTHMETSKKEYR